MWDFVEFFRGLHSVSVGLLGIFPGVFPGLLIMVCVQPIRDFPADNNSYPELVFLFFNFVMLLKILNLSSKFGD